MWHIILCFIAAVIAVGQEAAHCMEDGICAESFTSLLQTSFSHSSWASRSHLSKDDPIAGQPINVTLDLYDYREHARAFAAKHPQGLLDDTAPRVSLAEAERVWQLLLAEGWEENTGKAEFVRRMFNNRPGVIQGIPEALNWSAQEHWRAENIKERLDGLLLRENQYGYPGVYHALQSSVPEVTVRNYIERLNHGGNQIIFMNENEFPGIPSEKEVVRILGNDSVPRPNFSYKPEHNMDLFFLETLGTGHGWHHHGEVWHASVIGRKLWFLYPPPVEGENWWAPFPPIETDVVPNVCAYLSAREPPAGAIKVLTGPGDALLLPQMWWHSTCALDDWTAGAGTWMTNDPSEP